MFSSKDTHEEPSRRRRLATALKILLAVGVMSFMINTGQLDLELIVRPLAVGPSASLRCRTRGPAPRGPFLNSRGGVYCLLALRQGIMSGRHVQPSSRLVDRGRL